MDILVTGATGFVGRWLVLELTKKGYRVGACMRRASEREEAYRAWLDTRGGQGKQVECIEYDMLSEQNPWDGERFSKVKALYHTSALFQFGLTREQAHQTNVVGGQRVVRWAAALPSMERLILLGGYRLTSEDGRVYREKESLTKKEEDLLYKKHGAYEASKYIEYVALRAEARKLGLPDTVIHPSTVIGDAETGETTQFIGYAQTVKEMYFGQLPVLLGNEEILLPLVTITYVAQFMAGILEQAESLGQEYCLLDQKTPKFHALLRLSAEVMGVKAPKIKLPLGIAKRLPKIFLGERKEALPFLTSESYDTNASDALAQKMGLTQPPIQDALRLWLAYLVASRFGEETLDLESYLAEKKHP